MNSKYIRPKKWPISRRDDQYTPVRKDRNKPRHVLNLEKRTTQNGSMVCRGITKEQVKNLKIGITTIF